MQITVFGASGKVGQLVVRQLLDDGHEVVAFVHRRNPFESSARLRIVHGDIHDAEAVNDAIQGSKSVVSTLGSWGTKEKNIVAVGSENIISGMQKHSVRRIVSLTGSDARAPGDTLGILHRLSHVLITLSPARKILRDGERHIALLHNSKLEWTVVRSPIMNNRGDPSQYRLSAKRPSPWETINRTAVADAMVALAQDTEHSKQAPFIRRYN